MPHNTPCSVTLPYLLTHPLLHLSHNSSHSHFNIYYTCEFIHLHTLFNLFIRLIESFNIHWFTGTTTSLAMYSISATVIQLFPSCTNGRKLLFLPWNDSYTLSIARHHSVCEKEVCCLCEVGILASCVSWYWYVESVGQLITSP